MKKSFLSILIFLILCNSFLLVARDKKKDKAAERKTFTLKVGMVVTESDPMFIGAEKLKAAVESRTNGKLKIEIYPSSQLGDTKDMQEQAKAGANIAVITDAGRLAEMVPNIGILLAPYVVSNYNEAKKLVSTDLWKDLEEELAAKHGLRVLSFNWYQGARHLLTNKSINGPADLKGLRIRTPGATVWQATIKAMGGTPTALAWAEVYPGLNQKVIDGAEAQHPATHGAHLYEVVKYITKTGHFQLVTPLVTGETWFAKLPAEYQKILTEESFNAGNFASQTTINSLLDYEKKMKAKGVTINEIDVTAFVKATDAVYDEIAGYREFRKKINSILGK